MVSDEMKNSERWKQLHNGVDADGLVEDCVVETTVALPMALIAPSQFGYSVDKVNRYVAFVIDNGVTDIEVRLPFETVEEMAKWIAQDK